MHTVLFIITYFSSLLIAVFMGYVLRVKVGLNKINKALEATLDLPPIDDPKYDYKHGVISGRLEVIGELLDGNPLK